jgi:hypothetical protein
VDGACLCDWDPAAELEKEMAQLSMLPPPPLNDFDAVSIHTAPEDLSSIIPTPRIANQVAIRLKRYHHRMMDLKFQNTMRVKCNKGNQWR